MDQYVWSSGTCSNWGKTVEVVGIEAEIQATSTDGIIQPEECAQSRETI